MKLNPNRKSTDKMNVTKMIQYINLNWQKSIYLYLYS